MKHLTMTLLMSSLFALGGVATAASLTAEDVLSAIDGEAVMDSDINTETERVNFDVSEDDLSYAEDFWNPANAGSIGASD